MNENPMYVTSDGEELYDRYIPWRGGTNTETVLHELLNSLADGEHVKATWIRGAYLTSNEGPVRIKGRGVSCRVLLRSASGNINTSLISLEVTRYEEVTVTSDDEDALHELLDSLEEGQVISAEWCNENGTLIVTGAAKSYGVHAWLLGYSYGTLRWRDSTLHCDLRSVTVRRPVVQRWER